MRGRTILFALRVSSLRISEPLLALMIRLGAFLVSISVKGD
jgi:hypothetical protein